MPEPLVQFGIGALVVLTVALVLSIVLGLVRLFDWIGQRRRRRLRDAESARLRAQREEKARQRELANALDTVRQVNDMLLSKMLELARAHDDIIVLEDALARKERMRRIYYRKIQAAKEAGFTWR